MAITVEKVRGFFSGAYIPFIQYLPLLPHFRPDMVSSDVVSAALGQVKSTFVLKKIVKKKLKRRGDDVFNDGDEATAKRSRTDDQLECVRSEF